MHARSANHSERFGPCRDHSSIVTLARAWTRLKPTVALCRVIGDRLSDSERSRSDGRAGVWGDRQVGVSVALDVLYWPGWSHSRDRQARAGDDPRDRCGRSTDRSSPCVANIQASHRRRRGASPARCDPALSGFGVLRWRAGEGRRSTENAGKCERAASRRGRRRGRTSPTFTAGGEFGHSKGRWQA